MILKTSARALLAATALTGAPLAMASPAAAQSVDEQLQQMQSQVKALQAQIDELKKAQSQQAGKAAEKKSGDGGAQILSKGAPLIKGDGYSFKIRGRVQADLGHVSGGDGLNDPGLGTTTEFRRARLGVEGDIKDFKYKFEADFAGNEVEIADAYLEWKGAPVSITIGHQNLPISMEELTSSRFSSFMERAAFTDAFDFARQLGIAASMAGEDYTLKAGIYSNGGFRGNDESSGYELGARGTYTPKFEGGFAHLGAWIQYRANGAAPNRYRQRPQIHTTDTRFVDANLGAVGVDNDTFIGLEAAAVYGPFHVASEYTMLHANLNAPMAAGGDDSASFDGGYIEAGWFLTGETRGYKHGVWNRTKPSQPISAGGSGAWQLVGRYDMVDLNDKSAMITGGHQDAYMASLIWIPEAYVRFLANYGHVVISDSFPDADGDGSVDVLGLRAEIDW